MNYRTLSAAQSLVDKNMNNGILPGNAVPMARMDVNGLNGLMPDLRTLNAMTPYVRRNILFFVLETPRGFSFIQGGEIFAKILKALLETRAESIDGFDASVKLEFTEMNAGSNEVMHAPTRSTRERSEPTFKFTNSYGRGVTAVFETWITQLICDPITQIPGVVTLAGNEHLTARGKANEAYTLMPEMISMTGIAIEPDPTMSYPIKAWLTANMMPDNAGEYTGSMDKTSAPDKEEVTIKFTAIQETGFGVMELASRILASINKAGLNTNNRRAYLGDNYTANNNMNGVLDNATYSAMTVNNQIDNVNLGGMGYHAQAQATGTDQSVKNMEEYTQDDSISTTNSNASEANSVFTTLEGVPGSSTGAEK